MSVRYSRSHCGAWPGVWPPRPGDRHLPDPARPRGHIGCRFEGRRKGPGGRCAQVSDQLAWAGCPTALTGLRICAVASLSMCLLVGGEGLTDG